MWVMTTEVRKSKKGRGGDGRFRSPSESPITEGGGGRGVTTIRWRTNPSIKLARSRRDQLRSSPSPSTSARLDSLDPVPNALGSPMPAAIVASTYLAPDPDAVLRNFGLDDGEDC